MRFKSLISVSYVRSESSLVDPDANWRPQHGSFPFTSIRRVAFLRAYGTWAGSYYTRRIIPSAISRDPKPNADLDARQGRRSCVISF